jgi:predicted lipoprotein
MRAILVIAAVLGLSATSAMACPYNQTSASSDRQDTTGSITTTAKQGQAS